MKYSFLIGRNPELSIAELSSVFGKDLKNAFFDESKEIAIFDCDFHGENPQKFLNRLGSVIKIFEIAGENIKMSDVKKFCFQMLYKKFVQELDGRNKKSLFAVSLFRPFTSLLHEILMNLKNELKKAGIKTRFINKNFQNVSHVAVFEENLIEDGLDIGIFKQNNQAIIGKTVAIQDFKAYAKRDYGKPFRNPKAGMLPPKLAQIMINLIASNHSPASTIIYDPFCGTGGILMEAMLMGFSVIGSDISEKMIQGAKKNLAWLRENFEIEAEAQSFLFQKDGLAIAKLPLQQTIRQFQHLIFITESYLGEPLEKNISEEEFQKIKPQFLDFYEKFFGNLKKEFGLSAICMAIPMFRSNSGRDVFFHLTEFENIVKPLGFKITGKYQYCREGQYVGREIFVLK